MSEQLKGEIAERIGAMVSEVATRWAATANEFSTSEAWAALIESLDAMGAAFDAFGVLTHSTEAARGESVDPERFGRLLGAIVTDVLMTDGIVEQASGDACTLLIGAASVRALGEQGAERIADAIEDLQVRLVASVAADKVQLSVRVGVARTELVAVRLGPGRVAFKSDLPAAKGALEQIGTVFLRRFRGRTGPGITLPRAQGRVSASLSLEGDHGFACDLSVLQPFAIELYFGQRPTLVRLAASKKSLSLVGDATRGRLHLGVNLGALHIVAPDDEARLDFEVPGLHFDIDFADRQRELVIEKLGFGDATTELKRDGRRVLAWELDQHRPLDVHVQPRTADKRVAIALPAGASARVIYPTETDEVPSAGDGQLTVALSGDGPVVLELPSPRELEAGLRVEAGTLTVKGRQGTTPVRVSAGHRLVLGDGGETGGLWSRLAVVGN